MKWVGITILLLIIGGGWHWLFPSPSSPSNQPSASDKKEASNSSTHAVTSVSSKLFIPYWNIPSLSENLSEYDTLIYFGVAPDSWGVMNEDLGFKNIESFITNTSSRQERLLTIRMLDDEVSLSILDDTQAQKTLIAESIDLAQEYQFDGIVLDLELGVIPFENSKDKITAFVEGFSREVQDEHLTFGMTMYGDAFYRARPYDMAALSRHLDHLYIMAYDFHKSRGEPGPNFPFDRQSLGDGGLTYDFQTMIVDFTDIMSPEDITVVFGMYGYDWTLGPQGLPLKQAVAVPLNEIDQDGAVVDPESREKHILFTDDEGFNHELWYEDRESVEVKIDYLMEQGVGSVGYWVWGYF